MASNQGSVKNLDLLCPSNRSSCNNNQCSNSKASDLLNACHCALRSQISGAMKAPDSPGDDISCISGLGKSNAAVNNSNNDGDKKTNESGSSVSVNSFPSSQKAFNNSQQALCKMQGNSVELVNNHLKRSMKGSEPCIVDSSNSPPLREPSPKGEASVCSEEKGESSSTAKPLGGQEAGDVSEHLDMKDYKEKLLSVHHTYSAELPIPSGSADIKTGSDHADEEVRVCDICGDVGREDLLAICTKCIDGAEHIYCMCIKMDKVPAGDWLCEDCKINQESGMEREKKVEEIEKLLKRSYSIKKIEKLGSFDPSNSRKRLQVDVGASDLEKKTANAVSCSPRMPSKISSSNSESSSMTKKRTLGIKFLSPDGPHPQKKLFQDVSSLSQKNTAERKVRPFPSSDSPRTNFSDGKSRLLKSKSFESGEMRLKGHQQQHQGHERRPIVSKNQGKGGHSKIFCKSQSFKGVLSRCSVPDISKTKILSSTSPRAANQIRVRQTEDNSSILQKSVLQFGSSSSDDKRKAQSGKLPAKPSASSNHCDLKMIQGCEHLIDSLESQKCTPQKVAGDQHDENNRIANNVKTESRCKANGLDANSSSRGLYLDSLVPCLGGVIPQVDISWKGGFEVSRGEGLTDLYPFIQAHKSNHACDKVDAAVKKLPQKIVLSEATRLSTWPTQFKDSPAMEENIALFFFAENLESYGAYKSLLERITVNDLALKGHLEGVELLILSSKVLPKEAQRWNNFLYLWGVFRITSVGPHENGPSSQNELHSPALCTNNTSQQISTADDLPLTSPSRICENSESVLSSGPKFLPAHTIDHQLCLINSFKGGEGDLYRSRKLDLGFRKDNNTRDLAFGASNEEDHTNRKMKAIVNGLPKPCSQNLNIFFDAGSSFYHRDLASSGGVENINDARIPTGDEQSTLEDVNLELSLGPVNQMGKRKALSLNFEPSDDKTCPMKRLQSDEEEPSISIGLSLALPSRGEEDQEI